MAVAPATIFPIVEGHGEVEAVPILLRRIAAELLGASLDVLPAFRVKRSRLLKPEDETLRRALGLARVKLGATGDPRSGTVLVLLDGDDDCPKELADALSERVRAAASDLRVAIAVAKREFEAWFLAAAVSLRGRHRVRESAEPPAEPETIRGAKERLERDLFGGAKYSETADQPALTALMKLEEARTTRSFRHLVAVVERALATCRP